MLQLNKTLCIQNAIQRCLLILSNVPSVIYVARFTQRRLCLLILAYSHRYNSLLHVRLSYVVKGLIYLLTYDHTWITQG